MKITALLLNWKRQDNIIKVINSIKKQTVKVDIWLWNNNKEDNTKYDVDVQINSTENFKCWPRWLMGSMVDNGYIFTLDDDIMFNRNDIIETCIKEYEKINIINTIPIIGYSGVIINEDKNYWTSHHIHKPSDDNLLVDIIKGRFMFMSKNILENVKMENEPTCEDIKISSYSQYKLIPASISNGLINLSEGMEALHQNPIQRDKRVVALRKYFK
jgi:hypothetical protein